MTEEERQPKAFDDKKDEVGVEIGMGEPNSFEPEEDPDAAPEPDRR